MELGGFAGATGNRMQSHGTCLFSGPIRAYSCTASDHWSSALEGVTTLYTYPTKSTESGNYECVLVIYRPNYLVLGLFLETGNKSLLWESGKFMSSDIKCKHKYCRILVGRSCICFMSFTMQRLVL